MIHAGTYGATLHYLKAVAAAGTTDATKVVAKMKELPIDDFYTKGTVREDGRVMRPYYLLQVKKPSESRYPFSTRAVSEAQTNYIRNAIAVICGLGVLVFVCLATDGLDMSVGFF
jgi:hypothetical protein